MQYRGGICRFADGPDYAVSGVLDCVVDAEALLSSLHQLCILAGVTLLPQRELQSYSVDSSGVTVCIAPTSSPLHQESLRAKLLIDGLGAMSPHARFDLCCPTVGGVMDDLEIGDARQQMNRRWGNSCHHRRHPRRTAAHLGRLSDGLGAGRCCLDETDDGVSVLLPAHRALPWHGPLPLLNLYERFLRRCRATSGDRLRWCVRLTAYIPAYTRLHKMPKAPRDRVLLVGDAAGRHSPLTFCGFGSMVRSFYQLPRV